jgi:glycerophosphoryl diester phosphodiesterase
MPEVISIISEFSMHNRCIFSGNTVPDFNAPTVHRFFICPYPQFDILPCDALLKKEHWIITKEIAEELADLFKSSKNPNFLGFNFDHRKLKAEALDVFLKNNIPVICWTVNDERLIEEYVDKGIYAIATDKPGYVRSYQNVKNPGRIFGIQKEQ